MGSKWTFKSLNELGVQLIDCMHKTPSAQVTGVPYIGIPQMKNGEIDFEASPRLISESDYKLWTEKANPQYGDIILSRRCNPGETAFVSGQTQFALGQNLVILRTNGLSITAEYLRWALNSSYWWDEVEKYKNPGAIFDSLKCGDIPNFQIPAPPLRIQNKISSVLDLLTDRINLSNKVNKTLEQISQTLFKSWFVDFDPVIDNALDAGNPIPEVLKSRAELRQKERNSADFKPLPADIRALFPAEFEETELGWVPKGWQPQSMHDLVESVSITYPLSKTDKVIFLNTGDIEKGSFLHQNYSKTEGLPGQAKKSIKKGDILFSEIRPENKRYAFVHFEADDYVVSTKLMVLRAKNEINPLLPYFIITLEDNTKKLQRVAELRSGTFPQITFKELEYISFIMPNNDKIMELFINSYLTPAYNKIIATKKTNMNFINLRDTLLPKLISGELSLEDLPDFIKKTEAA